MTGSSQRQPMYRFGLYEVFPDAGELWKHGHRIKLQEQPFRLLVALLERPGEIVSREAIRERLWPENTFVEFDQSLGTAVTKLRQALNDEADNPRFIETIPKRGYRFIAPVTRVAAPEAATPVATQAAAPQDSPQNPTQSQSEAASPKDTATHAPPAAAKRRWLWAALTVVLAAAALAAFLYRHNHAATAALQPNDSLILAAIENSTGDTIFDDTLSQAIRVKLAESPYFNVVSERAVRAALTKSGGTAAAQASAKISTEDARAECAALNAKAVVSGNVIARPGGYALTLIAAPCGPGRSLATEQVSAASREEVLSALGTATDNLRRKLGEPKDSIQRFGTPVADATTSSLAALQAFSNGEIKRNRGLDTESIQDYKLATDLDPNFALAYARLGVLYCNSDEQTQCGANYQKAFDLREHTTERERLIITAHYYSAVPGDLEKTVEVYLLWRQLYPNDVVPPNNLSDFYEQLGQPDKSLQFARDAVKLNPNNVFPYTNVVQAAQRLGKFDEAKKTYAEAASRNLDYIGFHMALFQIAFAEHDEAEMQRQADWAKGNPREGELLDLIAWSHAARGQMKIARTYFRQAEEVSGKNGLTEFAADIMEDDAQFEVDFGFVPEGRAQTEAALKLAPDEINVIAFAAMIFARAGDLERAESYLASANRLGPHYTIYQKIVLPTARASIDLHRSDPNAALAELAVVLPFDLGRVTEMCPIYYRAETLIAAHRFQDAAAEYQRLIDHASIRTVSPYIPLSHLGIARARRADGDKAGAAAEYKTFFELWKDADPDIPILREARAEFAHL
jgi:DNA-binding winged helix-turn-helix (wHTH) protein/tetratricopeptide (TPR) repeat protein